MASFELGSTTARLLLALAIVLAALAVALLVMVVRRSRSGAAGASTAPAEEKPPRELAPGESASLADVLAGGASADPFMMKFVTNPMGERVGETITATPERLVLKHEGRFLAVPLSQVTLKDDELSVPADVDWKEAEREGEAWRMARHDAIQYDEHGNPLPKA